MYTHTDSTVLRAHVADFAGVVFRDYADDDDMTIRTYADVHVTDLDDDATCGDCHRRVADVASRALYYADAATTLAVCADCAPFDL